MTTSGLGIISLFSENAKFDGTNWLTWKETIITMIVLQMITYLVYDGLRYRFKVLIGRVRQATKDVVKTEV